MKDLSSELPEENMGVGSSITYMERSYHSLQGSCVVEVEQEQNTENFASKARSTGNLNATLARPEVPSADDPVRSTWAHRSVSESSKQPSDRLDDAAKNKCTPRAKPRVLERTPSHPEARGVIKEADNNGGANQEQKTRYIYQDRETGMFSVQASLEKRRLSLGAFKTFEEARRGLEVGMSRLRTFVGKSEEEIECDIVEARKAACEAAQGLVQLASKDAGVLDIQPVTNEAVIQDAALALESADFEVKSLVIRAITTDLTRADNKMALAVTPQAEADEDESFVKEGSNPAEEMCLAEHRRPSSRGPFKDETLGAASTPAQCDQSATPTKALYEGPISPPRISPASRGVQMRFKYRGKDCYIGTFHSHKHALLAHEAAFDKMVKFHATVGNHKELSATQHREGIEFAKIAASEAVDAFMQAHPEELKLERAATTSRKSRQKHLLEPSTDDHRRKRRIRLTSTPVEAESTERKMRTSTRHARKASEALSKQQALSSTRSKPKVSSSNCPNALNASEGSNSSNHEQLQPEENLVLDISNFTEGLPTPHNSEFYVEETAWRLHNPSLPLDQAEFGQLNIPPLPPPLGLPEFPNTGHCVWTWYENARVLFANFRCKEGGSIVVSKEDEMFLLSMMLRDDISVISEGLADELNPDLWNPCHLRDAVGHEYYHKLRKFQRRRNCASVQYDEVDKCVSMKIADYVRYLELRRDALTKRDIMEYNGDESESADTEFTFDDDNNQKHTIDVIDIVLYMIDLDVVKLLPIAYEDFASSFKLPGCLPGGKQCMMNTVNVGGRPFMGPNLYVTPPASFTHFHQDGHGTVDSGHQCLSGYNEVVMLRRLPESHKRYALYLLNGSGKNGTTPGQYNALYGLPHGDGVGAKPNWPESDAIERCKAMGYCPSVFVLKPGQHVHINKGRLHAFRKMAPSPLPEEDCHAKLRNEILQELGGAYKEEICVSVAWDWMYRGVSSEGINREVVSMLECAGLNRNNSSKNTLAIPELCILNMARKAVSDPVRESSWLKFSTGETASSTELPPAKTVLKGILSSLRYTVGKHTKAERAAKELANPRSTKKRVSIAKKPNSWENPDAFALDPYGNSDFFCRLCQKELSNMYMHCDGCEKILSKDYNICVDCYTEERYKIFEQMHPLNNKRHSTVNHTGCFHRDFRSYCRCKNGPACKNCGYCSGCSCKCHQWFTLNYRFLSIEDEQKLLEKVEERVGYFSDKETTARLAYIGSWNGRLPVDASACNGDENVTLRQT